MSQAPEREPLSHVDSAWLRMDSPDNPMVITVALMFDGPVPFERVQALIEERLLPHRRFKQRAVDPALPLLRPHWENDPDFDLRGHVHHTRLPAPADRAAFASLLSDLMSTRLDRTRPLWQVHVVDDAPSGTALIVRLHHCIGDGVSLVRLLLSMCDEAVAAPPKVGLHRPAKATHLGELAARAASQAATLGKLLLLPPDTPTLLKGPLGAQKLAAWSPPVSLADVKDVAKRLEATVNDVLCAAVAGALRAYLLSHDALVDPITLRAMLPVFFQEEDTTGLGNHFGLVFLEYPVGIADPVERVRAVKRGMDAIKGADDATVAFGVLDAIGVASTELEHIALEIFTRKATLLTTNVPGPPERVSLSGASLREMLVWAPVSGHIGLGVTLITYAGHVHMGVNADAKVVPCPEQLAEAFVQEIDTLIRA